MMKNIKQIDVSRLQAYLEGRTERLTEKLEVLAGDQVIAQLLPPDELSVQERQAVLDRGWEVVQAARKHSKSLGLSEDDIGTAVDEAVAEVRSTE